MYVVMWSDLNRESAMQIWLCSEDQVRAADGGTRLDRAELVNNVGHDSRAGD